MTTPSFNRLLSSLWLIYGRVHDIISVSAYLSWQHQVSLKSLCICLICGLCLGSLASLWIVGAFSGRTSGNCIIPQKNKTKKTFFFYVHLRWKCSRYCKPCKESTVASRNTLQKFGGPHGITRSAHTSPLPDFLLLLWSNSFVCHRTRKKARHSCWHQRHQWW